MYDIWKLIILMAKSMIIVGAALRSYAGDRQALFEALIVLISFEFIAPH